MDLDLHTYIATVYIALNLGDGQWQVMSTARGLPQCDFICNPLVLVTFHPPSGRVNSGSWDLSVVGILDTLSGMGRRTNVKRLRSSLRDCRGRTDFRGPRDRDKTKR